MSRPAREGLGSVPDTGTRSNHSPARYRPDIDGLRAVAIVPVVAYHLRLPLVTGGFAGVDVFFVISGFLVGSLILREIGAGAFTFADFYRRRIARIVPALLAVAVATLGAGWRFLPPPDYEQLALSVLAAVGSVSNIFFWQRTSYFDPALDGAPMLHTWSLGVEEQFYVVAPVLLLLATRLRAAALKAAVAGVSALSFVLCVAATSRAPEAAFYLLPFRFWELGLGLLVALRLVPVPRRRVARAGAGLTGLALIAASTLVYTSATPFPGVAALAPCLGAAMVIHAGLDGEPALPNRLLGWGPVRFVGLVSYSLYLWHWPFIVLQTSDAAFFADGDKLRSKLGLFAIVFTVAVLSWRFVERPAREAARGRPASVIVPWASAAALVAAVCGVVLAFSGFADRYPPEAARLAAYPADDFGHFRRKRCFITQEDRLADFDARACLAPAPDKPNELLLGDSHAAHLWHGLSSVLPGVNFEEAAVAGCPPTIVDPGRSKPFCRDVMDGVYASLKDRPPAKLILAARWRPNDVEPLAETLRRVRAMGVRTVLIGPIVQYGYALPRLLADGIRFGDPDRASRFRDREAEALDVRLGALARSAGVDYISLQALLCGSDRCVTLDDERAPLQFDGGHLTAGGSTFVARKLVARGLLP